MFKRFWAASVAAGLLATTSVGTLHAEQRGTSASAHASGHTTTSSQSAHATSSTRAVTRVGGGIAAGPDASVLGGAADAVAGGVGINARAMLSNQAAPDHNVKMVFSLDTGNYLADVRVRVQDRAGRTVIDGVADGPWLYAKLPAGTYTAHASYHGRTVTETFTVGKRGERVAHFRWPASVEHQAAVNASVSPILGTGPQEAPRF